MPNKTAVTLLMVIALVVMAIFSLLEIGNVPTAAITYDFGEEQREEIRICQDLGGTPWVSNENHKTIVNCELNSQ